MSGMNDVQEGMQVYSGDQLLGRVDRVHGGGFDVSNRHYDRDSVVRIEHNRIYIEGAGRAESGAQTLATDTAATQGEVRVPVVEEELRVGKREVDLGEVEIRRRVVEEERTVPVTLRREEVTVEQVGTPERALEAGEDAFQEGTIRVPVRAEEAVVDKEAVVTGEVVVNKDVTSEQRQVGDTVRRTEVDFNEDYDRTARTADTTRTMSDTTRMTANRATRGGTATDMVDETAGSNTLASTAPTTTAGRTKMAESAMADTGRVGTGLTGTTDSGMTDATPGRADAIPQPRMGDDNPVETMSTVRSEESEDTNPHYQAGYRAGTDTRFTGRSFEDSESDLRSDYTTSGGTDSWEQLREQIRAGFSRARGQ